MDTADKTLNHVNIELPIPVAPAPEKTEYSCDVLVVGGGFAGLMAAVTAKEEGKNVILVDKGYPGYSGQSAWASCHTFFDENLGDNKEEFEYLMLYGNEYVANLDWGKLWEKESRSVYEKFEEMGLLKQYPRAEDSGYYVDGTLEHNKMVEYHRAHIKDDRHAAVAKALKKYDIPFVPHTMILDIVESEGRVTGAVGLHFKSCTIMKFAAKAVVLCTGSGVFKPCGFPGSEDTYDGEYIGYMHGLPLTGQEFEDYHKTTSQAPGNLLCNECWSYLENYWLGAPTGLRPENKANHLSIGNRSKGIINSWIESTDGIVHGERKFRCLKNGSGTVTGHPDDNRFGKTNTPVWAGDVFGAGPGLYSHFAGGIFCGIDDLEGKTDLQGLWVAGEGINGCMMSGGTKRCPGGMTSNFAGMQGKIAGQAAAKYSEKYELLALDDVQVKAIEDDILAPLKVERGFHPNWAREILVSIMSPYWISIAKSEDFLNNALFQVENLRDNVVPKLTAANGHELRLCHEMKHKVLVAELKLRASLERRESRGYHYRKDYPYRDDKNFLCFLTERKAEDGSVRIDKIDIKDEWKGDLNEPYKERYAAWHFPGELEAIEKLGVK